MWELENLYDALDAFVEGGDIELLNRMFYDAFVDLPSCQDGESEHQMRFFNDVCEKIDFTKETGEPDLEERRYGWINVDQLREWLKRALAEHRVELASEQK